MKKQEIRLIPDEGIEYEDYKKHLNAMLVKSTEELLNNRNITTRQLRRTEQIRRNLDTLIGIDWDY